MLYLIKLFFSSSPMVPRAFQKNRASLIFSATLISTTLLLTGCGTPADSTPSLVTPSAAYKDGTYSATGKYTSPAGPEELGVTVTLKNNIVTDANVETKATAKRSMQMQQMFADNYKQFVVGKNINELNLGKISGSSLTPEGFNNALAQIKAQAK